MAVVWAIKSGSWSDPTVWNTGVLPSFSDEVHTNSFVVGLDININVLELTNIGNIELGILVGGRVTITLTGTYFHQIGTIEGYSSVSDSGVIAVNVTNSFIYIAANRIVGANFTGRNRVILLSGNNTVMEVFMNEAEMIPSSTVYFLFGVNAGATLRVFGEFYGNGRYAIVASGAVFEHEGVMRNSLNNAIMVENNSTACYLNGVEFLSGSFTAGNIPVKFRNPFVIVLDENENPITLTDPSTTDQAPVNKVVEGTIYNNGSLEGTFKVPPKGLVSLGTPVGDKVGEAILTAEAVAQAAAQVVGAQFNSFKA